MKKTILSLLVTFAGLTAAQAQMYDSEGYGQDFSETLTVSDELMSKFKMISRYNQVSERKAGDCAQVYNDYLGYKECRGKLTDLFVREGDVTCKVYTMYGKKDTAIEFSSKKQTGILVYKELADECQAEIAAVPVTPQKVTIKSKVLTTTRLSKKDTAPRITFIVEKTKEKNSAITAKLLVDVQLYSAFFDTYAPAYAAPKEFLNSMGQAYKNLVKVSEILVDDCYDLKTYNENWYNQPGQCVVAVDKDKKRIGLALTYEQVLSRLNLN